MMPTAVEAVREAQTLEVGTVEQAAPSAEDGEEAMPFLGRSSCRETRPRAMGRRPRVAPVLMSRDRRSAGETGEARQ